MKNGTLYHATQQDKNDSKSQIKVISWNEFKIHTRASATDVRTRLFKPTFLVRSSNLWVAISWELLEIWLPTFNKFAPPDLSHRSVRWRFFEPNVSLYLSNLCMESRNVFTLSLGKITFFNGTPRIRGHECLLAVSYMLLHPWFSSLNLNLHFLQAIIIWKEHFDNVLRKKINVIA